MNKDVVGIIDKLLLNYTNQRCIEDYHRIIITHDNSNDNFHFGFKSKYNLIMWRPVEYISGGAQYVFSFVSGKRQCLLSKNY
jgi:hypothetical protein